MISPDPELAEHSDAIERRLASVIRGINPENFQSLLGDPGISVIRSTMASIDADSMSIWLIDDTGERMAVTQALPDQEFVGWSQPVGEGLIGLTYASEQSLCENRVYENASHSKRADEARSQVTCALIATPIYIGGTLEGVLSCVQLKNSLDEPDPSGFTARNMTRVRRLSKVIERLVNYRLLTQMLGIEL